MSGVGHYGMKTGDRVVTEDDPAGDDFLAALTTDWENEAERVRAAGVRLCIPRLGLVLGRGGGVYGRLHPLFQSFVGGPIGNGRQYMPWVHVRDATGAILAMIDRGDFGGGAVQP